MVNGYVWVEWKFCANKNRFTNFSISIEHFMDKRMSFRVKVADMDLSIDSLSYQFIV